VVFTDIWRWKKKELVWHINRRECNSLLRGLRALVEILEYAANAGFGKSPDVKVNVFSDSKSSVRWCSNSPPALTAKRSVERRAIQRLSLAIKEELKVLRSLTSSCSVEHRPGCDNSFADGLSRFGAEAAKLLSADDSADDFDHVCLLLQEENHIVADDVADDDPLAKSRISVVSSPSFNILQHDDVTTLFFNLFRDRNNQFRENFLFCVFGQSISSKSKMCV
jgi:hypothetical protein